MSGSHFNPSISLCMMFRSDSPFGNTGRERLLGLMYIGGQMIGGILAAIFCNFVLNKDEQIAVQPLPDPDGKHDTHLKF